MSLAFLGSLAATVLLGVAAFVLLMNKLTALQAAVQGVQATLGLPLRATYRAARHLLSLGSPARQARYRTPWVLLLGERGAGKSAWAASARRQREAQGDVIAGPGPVPRTQVLSLRQGVLFDPDGAIWGTPADCSAVLGALSDERPERALDALLLMVSAASLRDGDADAHRRLGLQACQQLEAVRQQLGLLLPVYVVVSHCDALEGFAAFWQPLALSAEQRQEMAGWSAPGGIEPGGMGDIADEAFDAMATAFADLQVDAAQREAQIPDAMAFLLYPQRLAALREPLRRYLAMAFREQGWQSGFACRGLYFVGAMPGEEAPPPPRADLAFVGDLLTQKLLAERGLARVARPALWSRDRMLRSLQTLLLLGAAALLGGTAWRSLMLADRVAAERAAAQALPEAAQAPLLGGCLQGAAVGTALKSLDRLDGPLRTAWMPWSLVAPAPDAALLDRVNQRLVTPIVLPTLACTLRQRLAQLDGSVGSTDPTARRQALLARAERAATLDRQLADYQRLVIPDQDAATRRDALNRLLQGLLALPAQGGARGELLGRALAAEPGPATEVLAQALPDRLPPAAVESLADLPDALRRVVLDDVAQGPARVASLAGQPSRPARAASASSGRPSPVLAGAGRDSLRLQIQGLTNWLSGISRDWLPLSPTRNPCQLAAGELGARFDSLRLSVDDRSRLAAAVQRLAAPDACFAPARAELLAMKLGPQQTPLLVGSSAEAARLNPSWRTELLGLNALAGQRFMQMDGDPDLACSAKATAWSAPSVDQALGYARDYLALSASQGLPPLGSSEAERPLFDQLARAQLERAMNGAMKAAQITPTSPIAPAALPVDDNLPQLSAAFGQTLKSLLPVQQLYGQLRLTASAADLAQCSRRFALERLQRVKDLAVASKLYAPGPGSDGQLLNLGSVAVTRDYLAQQLNRAATLSAYTQPYLTLLANTRAVNDGDASTNASFWANTAQELQRYIDQKDTSGQVGQLENLMLGNLASLTNENCATRLNAAPAGAASAPGSTDGLDLFSQRRQALAMQVRLSCTANAYANYLVLAQRFNAQLAGRYPFGDLSRPDVPLADAKRFFLDYAEQAAPLAASLAASSDPRAREALAFLKQLDATAAFLRSSLSAGEQSQPLSLTPSFRAQLQASIGSENLLSWALSSGARVVTFPAQGPTTLSWPFGQALSLDLSWTDGSVGGGPAAVWRPASGAGYQLRGATASFAYGGDWALLRLIEGQRPTATAAVDPLDATRLLLEFRVPTQRTAAGATQPSAAEARVYLGLTLSSVDPKTTAATAVVWPGPFPRRAPLP